MYKAVTFIFSIEKLTWADLAIADLIGLISEYDQEVLEKAPQLDELTKRVNALPNIQKWIEERPKTFMQQKIFDIE